MCGRWYVTAIAGAPDAITPPLPQMAWPEPSGRKMRVELIAATRPPDIRPIGANVIATNSQQGPAVSAQARGERQTAPQGRCRCRGRLGRHHAQPGHRWNENGRRGILIEGGWREVSTRRWSCRNVSSLLNRKPMRSDCIPDGVAPDLKLLAVRIFLALLVSGVRSMVRPGFSVRGFVSPPASAPREFRFGRTFQAGRWRGCRGGPKGNGPVPAGQAAGRDEPGQLPSAVAADVDRDLDQVARQDARRVGGHAGGAGVAAAAPPNTAMPTANARPADFRTRDMRALLAGPAAPAPTA